MQTQTRRAHHALVAPNADAQPKESHMTPPAAVPVCPGLSRFIFETHESTHPVIHQSTIPLRKKRPFCGGSRITHHVFHFTSYPYRFTLHLPEMSLPISVCMVSGAEAHRIE